jgi:hypothetical protein
MNKYQKYNVVKVNDYLLILSKGIDINQNDWYLKDNQLILKCTKRIRTTNDGQYFPHGNIADMDLKENLVYSGNKHCDTFKYFDKINITRIIAHLPLNDSPILKGLDLLPPIKQKKLNSPTVFKSEQEFITVYCSEYDIGYIWLPYSQIKNTDDSLIQDSKPRTIRKDNLNVWVGNFK